jgi:GxxExxY protein
LTAYAKALALSKVQNQLGYGFLEKVYGNATAHAAMKLGLRVEPQKEILVYYDGIVVGEYFADLLVNGLVIVGIKAVRKLLPEHEAQLLNYLKATPIEVGLLLNFGPKPEYQRKVYDNSLKGPLSWTNWPTDTNPK